jgi:hypothetical protein
VSSYDREIQVKKRSKSSRTGILVAIIILVAVGAVLFRWSTGSTLNALSGSDAESGTAVSKKELAKLSRLMRIEVISTRPNESGFLIFSGTITNNGTEKVQRAGLVVRSVQTAIKKDGSKEASGQTVGKAWIENIDPNATKDFTILTSVTASELDNYDLGLVELEMNR